MRGQGRVYRPKVTNRGAKGEETAVWWLDYSVNGTRYRESSGTTNKRDAQEMLPERMKDRRDGKPVDQRVPSKFKEFADEHLEAKALSGAHTEEWMAQSRRHLARAVKHFGATRSLPSISVRDVRLWATALKSEGLNGGTIRHHLNSLSNMYRRADAEQLVTPGYNPVSSLMEKPKAIRKEARWLEVPEAALLLEAARGYDPKLKHGGRQPIVFPYELIATYLLTGGREDEVLGLEVGDVSFDRRMVTFRPNKWRRLKTSTSHRSVQMWPQLEEILRPFVFNSERPPTELLFPCLRGGTERMITDFRKVLDAVGGRAGWEKGQIRSKMFRHTYCAARLQTLDRGEPVSVYLVGKEMGHGGDAMVKRIYGHLGQARHRAEVVEYRVEQWAAILGERLASLAAKANLEANIGRPE